MDYSGMVEKSESYLMHHGIKGQKWGVRRYQNEDGSLTDLGKKKYLSSNGITLKKAHKLYRKDPRSVHNYGDSVAKNIIKNNITDDDLKNIRTSYRKMVDMNLKSSEVYDKHYRKALEKLKSGKWASSEDIDTYASRMSKKELNSYDKNFELKRKDAAEKYYSQIKDLVRNKITSETYDTNISDLPNSTTVTVGRRVTEYVTAYLSYEYNQERRKRFGYSYDSSASINNI